MNALRPHWLERIYPRRWRERYSEELEALIELEGVGPKATLNVILAATGEWLFDNAGLRRPMMHTYRGSIMAMARHPSAYVPLILSGLALTLLLGYLAMRGINNPGPGQGGHDEGAAARIYQLLIGSQVLIIGWFLLRWGRADPRAALTLLALQMLAIAASFVPLLILES